MKTASLKNLEQAKLRFEEVVAEARAERDRSYTDSYRQCMDYVSAHTNGTAASTDVLVVAGYIDTAAKQRVDEKFARTIAEAAEKIVQELTGQPAIYRVAYTLPQQKPNGRRLPISKLQELAAAREALLSETMKRFEDKYASNAVRISRVALDTSSFTVTAQTRQLLEDLPEQFSDFTKDAVHAVLQD